VDDKQTCKGKFTWTSGNVYEGDYVDASRQARGSLSGLMAMCMRETMWMTK
jgi:hypothetical protein